LGNIDILTWSASALITFSLSQPRAEMDLVQSFANISKSHIKIWDYTIHNMTLWQSTYETGRPSALIQRHSPLEMMCWVPETFYISDSASFVQCLQSFTHRVLLGRSTKLNRCALRAELLKVWVWVAVKGIQERSCLFCFGTDKSAGVLTAVSLLREPIDQVLARVDQSKDVLTFFKMIASKL